MTGRYIGQVVVHFLEILNIFHAALFVILQLKQYDGFKIQFHSSLRNLLSVW